jgi:hypothetical protein
VERRPWYVTDLEKIELRLIVYSDKRITLYLTAIPQRPEERASRWISIRLTIVPSLFFEDESVTIYPVRWDNRTPEFDVARLLGYEGPEDSTDGLLGVPKVLGARLEDYASAHEGRPGPTNRAGYARMVYLSIVTITTLGYGDIVPITPWARAWIGVEAVTGILLIGLFLNALAQEIAASVAGTPGEVQSKVEPRTNTAEPVAAADRPREQAAPSSTPHPA